MALPELISVLREEMTLSPILISEGAIIYSFRS